MTPENPNYHNYIYSSIVLIGIIVCAASVYMSISKIDSYEHNTNRIHRLITASEIELATLENEIQVIEKTIADIQSTLNGKPENNKELAKQFMSFKDNISDLGSDIAEKQKHLIALTLLKTHTLSQIKTLFWINSALLVIGSLMIVFGSAALGFKLEIFQERRKKRRKDTESL